MNGNKAANNRTTESSDSRARCILCSLSAAFFVIGIFVTVAGIVVYILSSTGHSNYFFEPYLTNIRYNGDSKLQTPIIVAVALGSIGLFLIFIAMVLSLLACFTEDRCCGGGAAGSRSGDIETNGNHTNKVSIMTPVEKELLIENTNEPRLATSASDNTPKRPIESSHSPPIELKGDINTVGLPSTVPPSFSRPWVPPNGFSYIANPSQIHSHRLTPSRNPYRKESAI